MSIKQTTLNPKQVLFTTRIIWGALLAGIVFFAICVAVIINNPDHPQPPKPDSLFPMLIAEIILTIVTIPLGLFIRGQVFKRHWQENIVTPQGYTTGNIIAWACCKAPAFFSLIVCLIAQTFWPYIIPGIIAFIILLLTWPNGKAMFSHDADDNPYSIHGTQEK